MRSILFLGLLLVGVSSAAHYSVKTDTHICILNPYPWGILVIDRATQVERFIEVPQQPREIEAHRGKIFVLTYRRIYSIDLETDEVKEIVSRERELGMMALSGSFIYYTYAREQSIFIVNFKSKKKGVLESQYMPLSMHTHQGRVYVLTYGDRNDFVFYVSCPVLLCLKGFEYKKVHLQAYSRSMVFFGTTGLFFDLSGHTQRLNLENFKLNRINLVKEVEYFAFFGRFLYAVGRKLIHVIDTETLTCSARIVWTDDNDLCGPLLIQGIMGYVCANRFNKIISIDLKSNTIIDVYSTSHANCFTPRFAISDRHAYIDCKQKMPLPHKDFPLVLGLYCDVPFDLEVDLYGDGDKHFENFLQATRSTKGLCGFTEFRRALSCAHPKAYALAAYVLLHGIRCPADFNGFLEYYWGCDKAYFSEIPNHLTEIK